MGIVSSSCDNADKASDILSSDTFTVKSCALGPTDNCTNRFVNHKNSSVMLQMGVHTPMLAPCLEWRSPEKI